MNWTTKDFEKHLNKKSVSPSLFPDMKGNDDPHLEEYNILVDKVNNKEAIFIPKNVPSLKNNKEIFQVPTGKSICCKAPYIKLAVRQYKCTKCGKVASVLATRASIVPSKRHMKYAKESKEDYDKNLNLWLKLTQELTHPYYVGLYFIRDTKRDFDVDNAMNTILDLIVHNHWVGDDNSRILFPIPLGYHVNKDKAGVIIVVTDVKPIYNYHDYTNQVNKSKINLI